MLFLSDKDFKGYEFPDGIEFVKIKYSDLEKYRDNSEVFAIAGSRAMAIKAAEMNFPALKLFQLTSAGFDNVPIEKYREKGVFVSNAGSVYSIPIAETTIFSMLFMAKKLRKNVKNRRFKLLRRYRLITEIAGKQALIMGAGNIGTAIATRLSGFGLEIDGYDPYCGDKPQFERIIRTREELVRSLPSYDYIISTMPANKETVGFIDTELIGVMKKTAVVVNVGRQAVFERDALYNALKRNELGGAVLDMFEKLPNPITNKFRRLKNVLVLPGVSAISQEVNERLRECIYLNVTKVFDGEMPTNIVKGDA